MDRSRVRVPWLLVAGSVLLALLLFYVLFAAYLPAKQRIASLEAELKDVYAREAALQNKLAQQENRHALRDQQMRALVIEREALGRRLEDLQRELSGRDPARRR
jgi:septal ring factor EnvC (AmiA/AmiB activator)